MKPFLSLQSVDSVLSHIHASHALMPERACLEKAEGRCLASDLFAPHDLPGFDRSSMDGYAVRAEDSFGASEGLPALLQCVGECRMGEAPDLRLEPGQTARILTGGMLPAGADSVVMVEYSRPAANGQVEIIRAVAPGENVLRADDDAASGSLLIPAGTFLRPQEIGLLAAFGLTEVEVTRRPRLGLISTGDEVVPAGTSPGPGQIRDVNSHSLAALARSAGSIVDLLGLVRDDPGQLASLIRQNLAKYDIIAISGGSSAGMRDHTVEVFTSLPDSQLLVHGVAIRPGKPFILAKSGHENGAAWLVGLPGHVASALVCAHVFLRPLIARLQGRKTQIRPGLRARLTRSIASAQGRRDYLRVRLQPATNDEVDWLAEPLLAPSGLLRGLVEADGLAICPENLEGYARGEIVMVEILA